MATYKSDFLNILSERGFIHQVSEPDVLDARAVEGQITAYIGFDCTASSLHVGSLVQLMTLRRLQQAQERICQEVGLEAEGRKFVPHVTLARLDQAAQARLPSFVQTHSLLRLAPVMINPAMIKGSRIRATLTPAPRMLISSLARDIRLRE